eukprot:scaffold237550_cov36-Tisochrysis_lutea.AAC.1
MRTTCLTYHGDADIHENAIATSSSSERSSVAVSDVSGRAGVAVQDGCTIALSYPVEVESEGCFRSGDAVCPSGSDIRASLGNGAKDRNAIPT